MKEKMLHILLILAVIFLALCFIPIKRDFHETFLCQVLDQQDESYTDQVTVIFDGTYTDYLFKKDIFKGRIEIVGYEFLHPESWDIELSVGNYECAWITEFTPIYSSFRTLGTFFGQEDFESFFLWLMVPDENDPNRGHGRYFLTYPAMTEEEIYRILDFS